MNDYKEVRFELKPCSEDATDVLAQMLADAGYESFLPDQTGLTAYIRNEQYDPAAIDAIRGDFPFECEITVPQAVFIEGQDWNAEWEKNYFQPIVVADRCVVHSTFHHDVPALPIDIVIDPKMAFGTGHHSTTHLVISQLLEIPLQGAEVIDMGTGTGILAILCSKLGARHITAIEIDSFAFENTKENLALNHCDNITLINGDAAALASAPVADVFVANINRNVITADIEAYAAKLRAGGKMLLSGFYVQDIPVILAAAEPYGLQMSHYHEDKNWAMVVLNKN